MHIDTGQSRRTFLRRMSHAALAGSVGSFVANLSLVADAAADTASDYKAMVCVFLLGGNDSANTVLPYDIDSYAAYRAPRQEIAIEREALAATLLDVENDLNGRFYSLHPSLAPLAPIFADGRMAILQNVGTLVRPITKSQYVVGSKSVPPFLFSHKDQQKFFNTCSFANISTGWAGRMGDLVQSSNSEKALTCISTSGSAIFLTGDSAAPYVLGKNGANQLLSGGSQLYGSSMIYQTLLDIITDLSGGMYASQHAETVNRALASSNSLSSALAMAPVSNFPLFSANNDLAVRLQLIARTISVSQELGLKRQVFYVTMGGYDTHSNQVAQHANLLGALAEALKAFYQTTVQMGISEKVTTFTASDFGRALASNGDGTDHGWGGVHFILGGAVNGRRTYGIPPDDGIDTNDDIAKGRLIPTTSVDQYAATLANWFGVSAADLPLVFPNLSNFSPSTWNLGFL